MFEITVEDEFGGIRGTYSFSGLVEAKQDAKARARHEQGRASICDEEGVLVIEYRYEDGRVTGFDDLGNQVTGLDY